MPGLPRFPETRRNVRERNLRNTALAKEIVKRILRLCRKGNMAHDLIPDDFITVFYASTPDVEEMMAFCKEYVEASAQVDFKQLAERKPRDVCVNTDVLLLKYGNLDLLLTKEVGEEFIPQTDKLAFFQVAGMKPKFSVASRTKFLLEPHSGPLTLQQLHEEVTAIFGVQDFKLVKRSGQPISPEEIVNLAGTTIFVVPLHKLCPTNSLEPNANNPNLVQNCENSNEPKLLSETDHKGIINDWIKDTNNPY